MRHRYRVVLLDLLEGGIQLYGELHWPSGRARGFNPQGCVFIAHPVDQYVCTGKSQSLWDRVVG